MAKKKTLVGIAKGEQEDVSIATIDIYRVGSGLEIVGPNPVGPGLFRRSCHVSVQTLEDTKTEIAKFFKLRNIKVESL